MTCQYLAKRSVLYSFAVRFAGAPAMPQKQDISDAFSPDFPPPAECRPAIEYRGRYEFPQAPRRPEIREQNSVREPELDFSTGTSPCQALYFTIILPL